MNLTQIQSKQSTTINNFFPRYNSNLDAFSYHYSGLDSLQYFTKQEFYHRPYFDNALVLSKKLTKN